MLAPGGSSRSGLASSHAGTIGADASVRSYPTSWANVIDDRDGDVVRGDHLPNVTIGDDSVIGAGAVRIKDVP